MNLSRRARPAIVLRSLELDLNEVSILIYFDTRACFDELRAKPLLILGRAFELPYQERNWQLLVQVILGAV